MSLDITYRPRTYADVLGQEATIAVLRQCVASGQGFQQSYLFCGPHGSGKCVTGDTLVPTDQGLLPIRDLMGGPQAIAPVTLEVMQEKETGVARYSYRGGNRSTVKIKTHLGLYVEGTPNHRVRGVRATGEIDWLALGEVQPGDFVCVPRKSGIFGGGADVSGFVYPDVSPEGSGRFRCVPWDAPKTLTPEWGRLMGYLIGDGSCKDATSVSATNSEDDVKEDVLGLLARLCGRSQPTPDKRSDNGLASLRSTRKKPRAFLEFAGVGFWGAGDKRVPWSVLHSSREVCREFLRGYAEADGHVGKGGVEIGSKSHRLLHEVQVLLLQFGVVSRLAPKEIPGYGRHWRLTVVGTSYEVFQAQVGFVSVRKQEALTALVQARHARKDRITNRREAIPHQSVLVRRWYTSLPAEQRDRSAGRLFRCQYGKASLSRRVLRHLVDEYSGKGGNRTLEEHFRGLWEADYYYDQVTEVTSGSAEVFDLNVPGGEMFAGNGFMNHNTTLGRILARALLCESPVEGNPCDQCLSCQSLLESGSSADFVEVDAATNSGKADVERIKEEIAYSTFSGKRRIYLFDEAHQLSKDALDALLKPLEDNLPGSADKKLVCIFCTTEPEKMRITVISRCAPVFVIQEQKPEVIAERLAAICAQEGIEAEDEMLTLIAEMTQCHIRDALKAVEGVSMLGAVNQENVGAYLHLDLNATYLDLLEAIGEDLPKAFEAAKSLMQRVSPLTCYEKLADVTMLAYRASLGEGVPAYWNRERLEAFGKQRREILLGYAARFAHRPGRPTAGMLLMDIAHLHHVGGSVTNPGAVLEVRGSGQAPASPPPKSVAATPPAATPAPVATNVSAPTSSDSESVAEGGTIAEQDASWIKATGGPAARKKGGVQAPQRLRSAELSRDQFTDLLGKTLTELEEGAGPSRRPHLGSD